MTSSAPIASKAPFSALVASTETSRVEISPRTSTSIADITSSASAVATCANFSTSGSAGLTASSIAPPFTFTASGTNSPDKAFLTEVATAIPARSCASSVEAPKCGVATTLSNVNKGESVHGSVAKTSSPAPATLPDFNAS